MTTRRHTRVDAKPTGWPKTCGVTAGFLVAMLALPSVNADQKVLRVGVYNHPPELFMDDRSQLKGVLGELLSAMAQTRQWQLELVPCQLSRCLDQLAVGDIDLLPGIAWSEERAQRFAFHEEPLIHSWSQLYQRDGLNVEAFSDLEAQRVAVIEGSVQQAYLHDIAERFGVDARWVPVDDLTEGFKAVSEGRADLAVTNHLFGDWRAASFGLNETPLLFQPVRLFVAATPDTPVSILAQIDALLKRWKADEGSIYFDVLGASPLRSQSQMGDVFRQPWIVWGLGALLLAVTLLCAWLYRRYRRCKALLAAQEAWFTTVLDNVDACVSIKTPSLEYRYVNRPMSRVLGQVASTMMGKDDTHVLTPDSAAEVARKDSAVLASGNVEACEEQYVLKGDTQERQFSSIKIPMVGAPDGHGGICSIVTEVGALPATLDRNHSVSHYDPLTGLSNRRLLLESLHASLDQETCVPSYGALLFLDVDNFRFINDTQGYKRGDDVLRQLARRLREVLPPEALVARSSGDEFGVLLDNLGTIPFEEAVQRTESVAQSLLQVFAQLSEALALALSASIGIALFNRASAVQETVLKQVDLALRQAKASGGNTLCFFNQRMQATVIERASLENDLQLALGRNEFVLNYQKQVDHQGNTTGVEALIRWQHPVRGMVSPTTFIPLAEHNGLIVPIGSWVLRTACEQLAKWAQQPAYAGLTMSVNVSAVQFKQPDFVRHVEGILAQTQAPPDKLVLEVTESLLMHDPLQVRAAMLQLRAQGVHFALDDFGVGFSSLGYLKRLPLDELKIDRTFIRELLTDTKDAAIVDTTILLAASLDLTVIAEGVEVAAQFEWLKGHGCYRYQGYLFGRPQPIGTLFAPA